MNGITKLKRKNYN